MTKYITLLRGEQTAVDDGDYDCLMQWRWHKSSVGYAVRYFRQDGKKITVLLHREIMLAPDTVFVDHINLDRLDNRRSNLRLCTPASNQHNQAPRLGGSSEYKGVSLHGRTGKWRAQITIGGKVTYLGAFDDEIAAAMAYDRAAILHFGVFARINFPEE